MKKTIPIYISILAVIAVVTLQGFGLIHSYQFMEEKLFARVNRCFMEAMRKEASLRCIEASKVIGEELYTNVLSTVQHCLMHQMRPSKKRESNINEYLLMLCAQGAAYQMDSTGVYKSHIKPAILDSLFKDELYNIGYIHPKYRIDSAVPVASHHIYLNDLVYDSTLVRNGKEMATSICPYRVHYTDGYQATLYNPQGEIFKELQLFIIGTLLLTLIILFCIWQQVRTITKQNKLSRLHESFSHFIINNEMKIPMDNIVKETQLLQNDQSNVTPAQRQKYYRIIEESGEALLALTNRILTLYKLDNKRLELNRKEVSLQTMLEEVERKYADKNQHTIHFTKELKAETIFADEELFKEAIKILLDDLIGDTDTPVKIHFSATITANKAVQIKIKDNLPTIPAMNSPEDKRSRKLKINYLLHIIKAHGGTVIFRQAAGKCNETIIILPQSS